MTVSDTSRAAYRSLSPAHFLQPMQARIMALFKPDTSLSRQQISRKARISINGVCGRVDSMLAAGLLEEHGERVDSLTHKRQKLLRLPRPEQVDLFSGVN